MTTATRQREFPTELRRWQDEIEQKARSYHLDFFETIFEVLSYEELNQVAAYGGFPTRYPHWRFGMEYEELSKGYSYGLQKIYEMVINNDPCYAYLLECNALTDQKLVMAHVYGHCDFFKTNIWFGHTDRKMMDNMANHGNRVRGYMDKYGVDVVESFMDACLSIEDQIDIHLPGIKRREEPPRSRLEEEKDEEHEPPGKMKSKDYMEDFVNPRAVLEAERKRREQEKKQAKKKFPEQPEKDLLLFLIECAPLDNWQRDVLTIVRDEAYYFAPQAQTKIMNEGWASYWHSKIMTQHELTAAEVVDYADHHSGTVATHPGRINPYKLGIELFRDIEERWNTGRFGREYDECDDMRARASWDKNLGLGRDKIFQVRKIYNDVTFIDEFLTPEFCRQQRMFSYAFNEENDQYEIESREFKMIKERLLFSLTNFGRPIIVVHDANYENRGELYLLHQHSGVDLKMDYAEDTLRNIHKLWTRPVYLETRFDDKHMLLSFDGKEHQKRSLGDKS
ncbi:MAG: SpoVR family protein [Planctomycetes bacterium]|nr:SpoVR family protein [Planctomycetota bacterium]